MVAPARAILDGDPGRVWERLAEQRLEPLDGHQLHASREGVRPRSRDGRRRAPSRLHPVTMHSLPTPASEHEPASEQARICVARQPIFDRELDVFAYELL